MGQYFYLLDLRVTVGCSRWPATSLPQSGRCCRRMCCRDGLSCRLTPRLLNCGVTRCTAGVAVAGRTRRMDRRVGGRIAHRPSKEALKRFQKTSYRC